MTYSGGAHELGYAPKSKDRDLLIVVVLHDYAADQVDGRLVLVLRPSSVQAQGIVWVSITQRVVNCYCELHLPVVFQVVQEGESFEHLLLDCAVLLDLLVFREFPRSDDQSAFGSAFIPVEVNFLRED